MTTAEKLNQYVLGTYGRFPISLARGEGTRAWDEEGNSYLDFCMGIATCSLGHAHPRLVAALTGQASQLLHCSNLYGIKAQADLAEFIVEQTVGIPGKVFFSNSGAEANDGLIKLARRFGHARPQPSGESRFEVITCTQSFHGRTLGSMSATGQAKIQEGFDPLLPGFRHVAFNDLSALAAAITPATAAILFEPVQGEGGVNVAEREFVEGAAALCRQHDLLLLLDEVQCGFGRTGDLMGWRSLAPDVVPDGISWAKGMGGGFPIGAFWVTDRPAGDGPPVSALLGPGSHGSTYGGNPLACAASLAVLSEIVEQDLPTHARAIGALIKSTIAGWEHPAVSEVRGEGLLLGVGLDPARIATSDGQTPALAVTLQALGNGLLVVPAGPETVRLLPPLNVTEADTIEALEILRKSLGD